MIRDTHFAGGGEAVANAASVQPARETPNGRACAGEVKPTASHPVEPTRSPAVRRQLSQIAKQVGAPSAASFTTFAVQCAGRLQSAKRTARGAANVADKYHLLITTADHLVKADVGSRVAVVAREASERIVAYRIYFQR